MTREQRLSILGHAGMEIARLDGASDRPPSPQQLERLRRIFNGSGRKTPLSNAA
jgi:hypothetical protein